VKRAQDWQTAKASEGDEMQMSLSVAGNPSVGHGREKSKPRPSRFERVGQREKQYRERDLR